MYFFDIFISFSRPELPELRNGRDTTYVNIINAAPYTSSLDIIRYVALGLVDALILSTGLFALSSRFRLGSSADSSTVAIEEVTDVLQTYNGEVC